MGRCALPSLPRRYMPLWGPNRFWPGSGLVLRCLGPGFTALALGPGFRPYSFIHSILYYMGNNSTIHSVQTLYDYTIAVVYMQGWLLGAY